jgi:hypothetical protein
MRERPWVWPLLAVGFIVVVAMTVRDGDWFALGAVALIFGCFFGVTQFALRSGYEWRPFKGIGLVALGVMIVGFLVVTTLTASTEIALVVSLVGAGIAMLLVGLKPVR